MADITGGTVALKVYHTQKEKPKKMKDMANRLSMKAAVEKTFQFAMKQSSNHWPFTYFISVTIITLWNVGQHFLSATMSVLKFRLYLIAGMRTNWVIFLSVT